MKVGLVADIHGNATGLAAALAMLRTEGASSVFVAGDIVGYYPDVNEAIDLLRSNRCVCILGNHDAALLSPERVTREQWLSYNLDYVDRVISADHRAWLASLPVSRALSVDGRRLLLSHGSPWRIDEYVYPDANQWERFDDLGVDVVVMGHTHIPFSRRVGGTLIVNPGSCGQPRDYDPRAAFAVLDLASVTASVQRVEYDIATLQERVHALGFDAALATILGRTRLTSQ